ncbi:protein-arginine deiminase family protein [Microcoleus sp. FACHB-68]|uniref:protein-arginine deiminase family protein n=1 Tax=Microcoleus sp. FACHB-68 TaxID=2692826 RepID=UPI0016884054|nr:protein-arginine deiminase family protein [Microcoleus sp. FACHB-68]MBD1940099.1 protein-arginine deiminase [Microcoleus sp. FACHB-68]
MHRLRSWVIAITSALGMVASMELMYTPLSIAPPESCSSGVLSSSTKSVPQNSQGSARPQTNRCAYGLDYALYSKSPQPKSLLQPYQTLSQALETTETRIERNSFSVYGDTNRDGKVDESDFSSRQTWSWDAGALILFNNDDDDRKRSPDWQDNIVNGDNDVDDLAKVHLKLGEDFADSQLLLVADEKARPYINIFQKTDKGWQPVDLNGSKPITYSSDILLGVEAKQFANRNWNGLLNLKAVAKSKDKVIAEDSIQMRVAPWIMLPNTAKVTELYVSDRGIGNREFISQLKTGVEATGAKVNVISGGTAWKQDTMEIGYVQFPKQSSLQNFNVVLNGNRGGSMDYYPRSLLSRDFGWFEMGKPRRLDALNQWTDWFGNLEVTPPIPGYPHGRIYYGNAGTVAFHPEVVDFVTAQEVQGPPVDIDTSWLMIRHVDEIISFIPTPSGKPLMMIVSPEEGVNLLKELNSKGYGNELINRGLSTQTTVSGALNNKNLIEHNLKLQSQHLNPIIAKLKQEFNLSDDQIVRIPAMYGYGGYSWWPNMVNSVAVNGQIMASNPRGAIVNGRDYTQEAFRRRVARSALKVYFLEDLYYQELRGNTHCATNTRRKGLDTPFWSTLPAWLSQR